jgi:hypothetical protein
VGTGEAAGSEEVPPDLRFRDGEAALIELVRDLVRVQQSLPPAGLGLVRSRSAVLVAQLDSVPLRQTLHGLLKGGVLHGLKERDDIPRLPAAEAVVAAYLWADVETGSSLVVEGTQALVGADPGLLQCDVLLHHFPQVSAFAHRVDVLAPNQSCHGTNLPGGGRRRPTPVDNRARSLPSVLCRGDD